MNNDSILHWLLNRGISESIIEKFGLKYEDSIIIPIRDEDGKHLFNKHRRNPFLTETGPRYWYDKGGHVALFGAEFIKDEPTVVICEGELDALVLWSHNIPAVSSTGGALSINAERWLPILKDKELYVCLDNDEAGAAGTVKILAFFPAAKVIILPDIAQVKDITDYYGRGGDLRDLMPVAKRYLSEEEVRTDMQARKGSWQSTLFHEEWLKWYDKEQAVKEPHVPRDADDEVERAKLYPISQLIKVNKVRKALCPFHADKTPSFHVFPDNHGYCFACGRRADVIDVYRELHHCGFKEAVEELNKL
jgi:DNA primase